MTTEQLNIIITAQTSDFTEKLSAVNQTLRETISLAERAAASAAKVTDPTGSAEDSEAASGASGIYQTPVTSAETAESGGFPSAPIGSARAAVRTAAENRSASEEKDVTAALETVSPVFAAANVVQVSRDQTAFGAFLQNRQERQDESRTAPIEIHTTVELDGDRIGEAVAAYNGRRSRITDGFTE